MEPKRVLALAALAGIALVVVIALRPLVRAHGADEARAEHEKAQGGRDPDPKFCREQLAYYESYCRTYPKHCEEGPQKLARCVPW
jgi:hypothetical protein